MVNIDPQTYFDAAKKCHDLAGSISQALGNHRVKLNQCGGMAGNYEHVQSWATGYDQHANDLIDTTKVLANALQNFGDVVAAAGYNWATANYNANTDPNKGAPPLVPTRSDGPLYDGDTQTPPPSAGDNGNGLDTNIGGLLEQVGLAVPNGNADKLKTAADSWHTFSTSETVTGAGASIQSLVTAFEPLDAPDVHEISGHLVTLKSGADAIAQASTGLAQSVADHHDALGSLRTSIDSDTRDLQHDLAVAAATTVAVIALTTVVTFGWGLAGPDEAEAAAGAGAAAGLITDTALAIRGLITGSRLLALLAGAAGTYAALHPLDVRRALEDIAALTVASTADGADSPATAPTEAAPKQITGRTTHGEQQAQSRDGHGVSDGAMNDAVADPVEPVQPQEGGTFKYVGKDATVVLNQAGEVVTTWARNRAGWRNP